MASQIALKRRLNNEERLYRELSKFFKRLKKEVLASLEEYWSEYQMLQGHINLIVSPVHEAHKEYYEILRKYKVKEYELGKREATRLCNRAGVRYAFKETMTMPISGFIKKDSNKLFGTLPKAEQDLLDRTYKASENTLKRVDSQLNKIITDGYRSGKGINDVANNVTKRFDQLASWEAKRIARTEINTSHNKATVDTYNDLGVEYTQWIAASDDRTRDSHVEVDGEIIPMGGKYSNGLEYPGDMSGPIEEWINCRCSNAPFVIPYGYIAPSFSPFREDDLIPIDEKPNFNELTQNATEIGQEATMPVSPFGDINKFRLTSEEWARYAELKFQSENGGLKFKQKLEFKKLQEQFEMDQAHRQLVKQGKLDGFDAAEYQKKYNSDFIQEKFNLTKMEYTYALEGKDAPKQGKIITKKDLVKEKPEIPYAPKTKTINGKTYTNFTDDTSVIMEKQIAQQKKNGYTQKDISVVHEWGFEGHKDISGVLFNVPELKTGMKTDAEIYRDINALEKAINKGKGFEEPTTVFRGGEIPEGLKPGDEFVVEGFQSYSFDEDVARDFKEDNEDRFLITSHGDKGTKGVHIDDEMFQGLSEDEWLTQKGQKHRVISVDYEKQTLETEFINDW